MKIFYPGVFEVAEVADDLSFIERRAHRVDEDAHPRGFACSEGAAAAACWRAQEVGGWTLSISIAPAAWPSSPRRPQRPTGPEPGEDR